MAAIEEVEMKKWSVAYIALPKQCGNGHKQRIHDEQNSWTFIFQNR